MVSKPISTVMTSSETRPAQLLQVPPGAGSEETLPFFLRSAIWLAKMAPHVKITPIDAELRARSKACEPPSQMFSRMPTR
ncbi:hypothetical protein D3C84_1052800 [compost metagenome]